MSARATTTLSPPLEAARDLAATVRQYADETEAGGRLATPVVVAFRDAGLFRLCVPRALGGLEADVPTLLRVLEEVGRADGSAGWCVMIAATSGVVSAYLPAADAAAIYGGGTVISGGVFAPSGRAVTDGEGLRVTGRWAFASGCQHCDWLMGGCVIVDDGTPRLLPNGLPDARLVLFPASAVQILDTWRVAGLCGTGSHDIAVSDLRVPASRAVSLVTDRPRYAGPLFAFPVFGLLALGIAGVALGIGRRAIEELVALAAVKTPAGSRRRLGERAVVQMQVAQAEATLRAAGALLFETVETTSQAVARDGAITLDQRAALRLAATHATAAAAQAVDLMYHAGGGTAVYATSPLQRCFRDIHVATQHMMVAPATYELTGRFLLGMDADATML